MRGRFIIMFLAVTLLLCTTAYAQTINVTAPVTVLLGGPDFRASNPSAGESVNRDATAEIKFNIKNEGQQNISQMNITASFNFGFSQQDLNLSFDLNQNLIQQNEVLVVTVSGRLPEDLDAVNETTLKEQAFQGASMKFQGTSENGTLVELTIPLEIQRENQLDIDDLDICINGKCKNVDNSGDDVQGVRPGDEVEIRIRVENEFSDNDAEDIDIEDITVGFDIDDEDLNEDDDETISSLQADTDQQESFSFTLDEDQEQGTYDIVIRVEGEDENFARHGDTITIELVIEKKRRDVEIREADFRPEKLACGKFSTTLHTRVVNLGTKLEERVAVEYSNDELGISEKTDLFRLAEGQDRTLDLTVNIPEDAKPGDYPFKLTTFFEQRFASDQENLKLTLEKCEEETEENKTVEDSANETISTLQVDSPREEGVRITKSLPKKSTTTKLADSGFLYVIGALMLLAIIALVVIAIKLL